MCHEFNSHKYTLDEVRLTTIFFYVTAVLDFELTRLTAHMQSQLNMVISGSCSGF